MSSGKKSYKRRKPRPERLVESLTLAVLVLVGLIAVLEMGPPGILLFTGSTPMNTGLLGTSDLYAEVRKVYPNTYIFLNLSRIPSLFDKCGRAVLIIISPEIPYESPDLESLKGLLSRCSFLGVIVADETGNSNTVLEALGSSVRVRGDRILDLESSEPYPVAIFNTSWGYRGELRLDIASSLSGSAALSGIVPSGYLESRGSRVPAIDIPVAYEEEKDSASFFVIGDGSLFLNQILRSQYREKYLGLFMGALNNMCLSDPGCIVIFDGSKYIGQDPAVLASRGVNPALLITPEFIASAMARIIHPATWIPPLIGFADLSIRRILSISYLANVLVLSSSVLAISLVLLSRAPQRTVDRQAEDLEGFNILAAKISRGKTGRRDFLELSAMINSSLREMLGVSADDPKCPGALSSKGVEKGFAERFCRDLKRLRRRASLDSLRPLRVNWGSVSASLIRSFTDIVMILGAAEENEEAS